MHILRFLLIVLSCMACGVHSQPHAATRSHARTSGNPPQHLLARPTDADRWRATIRNQDYMRCFAPGTTYAPDKLAYCETSGVVYDGKRIIIANDKPIPGHGTAPIFTVEYDPVHAHLGQITTWFNAPAITQGQKFEDLTITPDGRYVIATTAWDRYDANDAYLDGFNRLVSWPVDHPEQARIIGARTLPSSTPTPQPDARSDVATLRVQLGEALRALDGATIAPHYFKIEGLAAMPDGRLIVGIREIGARFDDFRYHITLLSVPYTVGPEGVQLTGAFSLLYTQKLLNTHVDQAYPLGVSGLAWDPYQGVLWMLSSYEMGPTDEQVGGYLWALSLNDLASQHLPRIVQTTDGQPLLFAHKPEGIAVLAPGELLVVHDDDRILGRAHITHTATQFKRLPEEAAYTFIHVDHIVP